MSSDFNSEKSAIIETPSSDLINDDYEHFLQKEGRFARKIIIFYVIWLIISQTLLWIFILETGERKDIALLSMSLGLIVLWIFIGGSIMRLIREPLRLKMQRKPDKRVLRFFLFAILLACLEEVITTGMTNTAPLWGFSPYKVFITGSPNYFEVIFVHSVIVFLPSFLVWAVLLEKYTFHPNWVLILYGFTGLIFEGIAFGFQYILFSFSFWGLVYGLIVYLPAYCVPKSRQRKKPTILIYLLAIILPVLVTIPMALVVLIVRKVVFNI